ncbi:hypothetical protein E2562_032915 [Oryza meyeriana var. granulata]|uniref:Uncharacterized protein n=1 Tax=Oryza meyeriana var. granulata TaxID=110450 RepID=A0A6G1F0Z6_9ORYZ|nr:hypothetical protein E2562_032915 [Oryza meyeriana var. granulata]
MVAMLLEEVSLVSSAMRTQPCSHYMFLHRLGLQPSKLQASQKSFLSWLIAIAKAEKPESRGSIRSGVSSHGNAILHVDAHHRSLGPVSPSPCSASVAALRTVCPTLGATAACLACSRHHAWRDLPTYSRAPGESAPRRHG